MDVSFNMFVKLYLSRETGCQLRGSRLLAGSLRMCAAAQRPSIAITSDAEIRGKTREPLIKTPAQAVPMMTAANVVAFNQLLAATNLTVGTSSGTTPYLLGAKSRLESKSKQNGRQHDKGILPPRESGHQCQNQFEPLCGSDYGCFGANLVELTGIGRKQDKRKREQNRGETLTVGTTSINRVKKYGLLE